MTPRGEVLANVIVLASRPIEDLTARERAIEATLDVVNLESYGVDSFDEWARRLDGYASRLVLAHRVDEARMIAAAAAVLAA